MPRLLFVTGTVPDVPEGSGTHIGVSVLTRALRAEGFAVEVLAPPPHHGPISFLDRLRFNVRVRRRARELRPPPDLVVGVDLDGFLLPSGRVRRVADVKGVVADEARFERGATRWRLRVESLFERRHVRRVDRVITPSAYSAGRISAAYGVPMERIAVVPEPIDLALWRSAFDAAPELPREGSAILCVAHLYPRKNVAELVQAMARLTTPAVLRIVGRGADLPRLERLARDLGVGDRVAFLGHVDFARLAGEYRRADVFCLPSRQEGFGIVFLEAMAAGLPIVAARAAAVPEVVPDGACGLLVDPDDADALGAALDRLLGDPEARRRLGDAGRRRAELFDVSAVSRAFLDAVGLGSASRQPETRPR